APGYHSATAEGWGRGSYSIVTTRDIEAPAQLARLQNLPMVRGIAPINRLLLPSDLYTDRELRPAAAQLHADMVLVYTLDPTFRTDEVAEPLTLVSLGLAPNHKTYVITTASAMLMDTRNGYIYGVAESTEHREGLAIAWTSQTSIDESRRKTESAAFEK